MGKVILGENIKEFVSPGLRYDFLRKYKSSIDLPIQHIGLTLEITDQILRLNVNISKAAGLSKAPRGRRCLDSLATGKVGKIYQRGEKCNKFRERGANREK